MNKRNKRKNVMVREEKKPEPADAPLFVGLIMDHDSQRYWVYLVNNSTVSYEQVKTWTGAFASLDDDIVETSQAWGSRGPLPAMSYLLLEEGEYWELDFVIWYHLGFVHDGGQTDKYFLQLTKYGWGYDSKKRMLPVIGQVGMVEEFRSL